MIHLLAVLMYVDPSSSSLLMQILAPVFVLLSMLGRYFKKTIVTALRRLLRIASRERG